MTAYGFAGGFSGERVRTMRRFGDRDVYTVTQAARLLSVHHDTVQKWCRLGLLPATKTPGGHYRIADEALKALMHRPRDQRPANDNAEPTARVA